MMPQSEIQEHSLVHYHPKKIFSTDHTHSGIGGGDVKKAADNDIYRRQYI